MSRIGNLVAASESRNSPTDHPTNAPKRSFSTTNRANAVSTFSTPGSAASNEELALSITTAVTSLEEQVTKNLKELTSQTERLEEELQKACIENKRLRDRVRQLEFRHELREPDGKAPVPVTTQATAPMDTRNSPQLIPTIKRVIREQVFNQISELSHRCVKLREEQRKIHEDQQHAQDQRDAMTIKHRKLEKKMNDFISQTMAQMQNLDARMQTTQHPAVRAPSSIYVVDPEAYNYQIGNYEGAPF